ncbi:MAG: hypothetical protein IPN34_04455 [Planctomycetes bacterium]|nr:hypothetical protein [Planctomycetota bacterium]
MTADAAPRPAGMNHARSPIRSLVVLALAMLAAPQLVAQTVRFELPALRGSGWVHGALPCRPGEIPGDCHPRFRGEGRATAWVAARHSDGSARWIGISGFLRSTRGALDCSSRGTQPLETVPPDAGAPFAEPSHVASLGASGAVLVGRLVARTTSGGVRWAAWSSASVGTAAGGPWVRRLEARGESEAGGAFLARAALVRSDDGSALRLEGFVQAREESAERLRSLRVALDWSALGPPHALPLRTARQLDARLARIDGAELAGAIPERLELELAAERLIVRSPRLSRRWPCAWFLDERGLALEVLEDGRELERGTAIDFALELALVPTSTRISGAVYSSPRRLPSRGERQGYAEAIAGRSFERFAAWCASARGGSRDDGDTPLERARAGEPICWSNGEFDLVQGLVRAWWCGAPSESLELAHAALRHTLAVDIPTVGGDAVRAGLPWRHGVDHGVGSVQDLGHTWIEGWLALGRVRGDPLALDAAFAAADAIARARFDPRRELELERSYAWPVLALAAAAAEAPGAAYEPALAARGAALLAAYDRSSGRFAFEGRTRGDGARSEVHVWLSAGLLGEALDALARAAPSVAAQLGEISAREAAAGLLVTLWSEAWNASERRWAARVRPGPFGLQRLGILSGVPESYAVRGLELLAVLAGDDALLERALALRRARSSRDDGLREERWWNDFALAGRCLPCPLRPRVSPPRAKR